MTTLRQRLAMPALLQLATACGYAALALLALRYFTDDGRIGVFWPASGLALAMLLIHGRQLAWGVFGGALAAELISGAPLPLAVLATSGATAAALLGHRCLQGSGQSFRLIAMQDLFRLAIRGALVASGVSALVGVGSLTLFNAIPWSSFAESLLRWWSGDALGVLLLAPLVLSWRDRDAGSFDLRRWPEVLACFLLAALLGQVIFLDWLPQIAPQFPRKGYWLFPLLIWAAIRMGPRSVSALLVLATTQAMLGIQGNVGFFANASVEARLIDGWLFLATLSLVGMLMVLYRLGRSAAETDLRVAAIAFECQEGIIVLDARQRVLRTNHSFSRIMGYSADEVRGQNTGFMRSDRHPPEFYENAWHTIRQQGSWADEVWHRRKNGEVFPQWLTGTAVKDDRGTLTHFVVTHTDLTELKKKDAEQQARQIAQRDALIREVHHRIKNSLQGVTGVLRQFARTYPQTEGVMSHAISLVRGIAVLHGLQGRAATDAPDVVRLEALLKAVTEDLRAVWKTPITVDLVDPALSFKVAPSEAVPIVMVLNELLVNAVKHGGIANGHVGVTLQAGATPGAAHITISNEGTLPPRAQAGEPGGLLLVESMLPRHGAELSMQQLGSHVLTLLELSPPVVTLEPRSPHVAP